MAPVSQFGVLAFASAVLAVPHAQWQPFKRHAHPAPPAYATGYGASSSAEPSSSSAEPVSESASWSIPSYPSASGSSVEPVSGSSSWSAPAYPSASGSSVEPVSGSSSGSFLPYPSASGSSAEPVSGSSSYSLPPYGSASKSGWAFPTGGYGSPSSSWGTGYVKPTGYGSYSSYPTAYPSSISVCTETSTLIYKSTTEYSTFYVTHTLYESAEPSSVAPASVSAPGGYSAGPGGYSAPGAYSGPASAPASAPFGGESCVPDLTVTETVKTTYYVTLGAGSAEPVTSSYGGGWSSAPGAPSSVAAIPSSSFAAPSYPAAPSSAGAPSSAAAPSSPAAPSSAAAPSYSAPASSPSTGKRGLAYNDASLANALAGTAAGGWGYNWISSSDGLDSSIPYIPTLHDASSVFTSVWEADASKAIADGAQYLFSFNEPDMTSQANLSPEAAAAAWKQYMEPFAGQAKLVAPAVTNGQSDGMGLSWLTEFLGFCSDCTIDAVAMHWYYEGNPIDTFKEQISLMASTTGKGVWLNEFGATGTDDERSTFLGEVLPWLESNDSILGYSYFMVSDGLLMTGDSPSVYGKVYCDS